MNHFFDDNDNKDEILLPSSLAGDNKDDHHHDLYRLSYSSNNNTYDGVPSSSINMITNTIRTNNDEERSAVQSRGLLYCDKDDGHRNDDQYYNSIQPHQQINSTTKRNDAYFLPIHNNNVVNISKSAAPDDIKVRMLQQRASFNDYPYNKDDEAPAGDDANFYYPATTLIRKRSPIHRGTRFHSSKHITVQRHQQRIGSMKKNNESYDSSLFQKEIHSYQKHHYADSYYEPNKDEKEYPSLKVIPHYSNQKNHEMIHSGDNVMMDQHEQPKHGWETFSSSNEDNNDDCCSLSLEQDIQPTPISCFNNNKKEEYFVTVFSEEEGNISLLSETSINDHQDNNANVAIINNHYNNSNDGDDDERREMTMLSNHLLNHLSNDDEHKHNDDEQPSEANIIRDGATETDEAIVLKTKKKERQVSIKKRKIQRSFSIKKKKFVVSAKKSSRGRKKREPDQPKRPLSAYNLFFQQERLNIMGNNQQEENKQIVGFESLAKQISQRWNAMSTQKREPFMEQAKQLKLVYEKQMQIYRDQKRSHSTMILEK